MWSVSKITEKIDIVVTDSDAHWISMGFVTLHIEALMIIPSLITDALVASESLNVGLQ